MSTNYYLTFIYAILFFCFPTLVFSQTDLFNGKDLTGWNIHGTELWYVENGELVCERGPDKEYGYLSTKDEFYNYELILEFKQESDGNSGVFLRSTIDGIKISGWQVEVAPKGKHTGGIYESYGRGWLIKPKKEKEDYLNEGQWNQLKIRVFNNMVTTWLNGNQMIYLEDKKIAQGNGSIALQIHDGGGIKVRWRNFQLTKL